MPSAGFRWRDSQQSTEAVVIHQRKAAVLRE
jgi:hypothetical protein